jgi:hypothetical protein
MDGVMRVESDKRLFGQFNELAQEIANMATIVQNDHRVSRQEFGIWKKRMSNAKEKLWLLTMRTILHIDRCNRGL